MSSAIVKTTEINFQHESVMVKEVLNGLHLQPQGIYVDLTFGRGGHSKAILNYLANAENAKVFAMDKDPAAQETAQALEQADPRFKFQHQTFSHVLEFCKSLGIIGKVNGVVMDLGVSSPQLEEGQRGFSFKNNGPLDMRMDPTHGVSAAEWINTAEEAQIQTVFKDYGEERYSKRIAHAIIEARSVHPINTTEQLADIISRAHPAWEHHKHPATRCFQAIRIYINHELEELSSCLQDILTVLAPSGRLVVISFHSLEDRLVKRFIQKHEQDPAPRGLPLQTSQLQRSLRKVGRKQKPTSEEIAHNRRARSAVLRVAEKLEH